MFSQSQLLGRLPVPNSREDTASVCGSTCHFCFLVKWSVRFELKSFRLSAQALNKGSILYVTAMSPCGLTLYCCGIFRSSKKLLLTCRSKRSEHSDICFIHIFRDILVYKHSTKAFKSFHVNFNIDK